MKISIVVAVAVAVAVDANNGIGKNNKIPWHLPEDLKRFRKLTMGNPVLMGCKTYESIGNTLDGRTNYVVGHDTFNLTTTLKLAAFHEKDEPEPHLFIIGGASIYKQVLDMDIVDSIYITRIYKDYKCDTFFPLDDVFIKYDKKT